MHKLYLNLKFYKENINGILGTVLFHLIIVFILLIAKIQTLKHHDETYMIIEPEYLEENTEKTENEANKSLEDINIEDYINEIRNIGYNNRINQQSLSSISEDDLKKMYESEFLKEKYGDNYENFRPKNENNIENLNETNNKNKSNQNTNSNDNYGNYSGPSLVYVELENPKRGKVYIEVPVFTCRNGGKVIIEIIIGSDGRVRSTSVLSVKSNGNDSECIVNAAINAAKNSRFTTIAGGKNEKGKITYTFIEQ